MDQKNSEAQRKRDPIESIHLAPPKLKIDHIFSPSTFWKWQEEQGNNMAVQR